MNEAGMPAVQAAELVGCTPGHVSWLARHGHLPGKLCSTDGCLMPVAVAVAVAVP